MTMGAEVLPLACGGLWVPGNAPAAVTQQAKANVEFGEGA